MKEKIKIFFDKYYDSSVALKKSFKITEKKSWNAMTFISEINVQLGHLSYLISKNKEYGEKERQINNISDEISDILLQLVNICQILHLDIKSYNYQYEYKNFDNLDDAILAFNIVFGQVSEVIMEKKKYRHYKIRYGYNTQDEFLLDNISKLFEIIFSIILKLDIDILCEYGKMENNAMAFLERARQEKEKEKKYFEIVDVHATWLVLNPIQGCPKKCKYCFLNERNLNRTHPTILMSPEEAVKTLLKSKFYTDDVPVCLISQSDAFSTRENIEYLMQLINILMQKKVKNPIVFITKCRIPEYFISFIDSYEKENHKFIFFLSYSGLDDKIEMGVNKRIIEENFKVLKRYNKKIIHYWRPFIKENSTKEIIDNVYNYVKKYCIASVAIGLKTTEDIINNINWDELKINNEKALKSDNDWNKKAFDYVWNDLKNRDDYPIFQTTSCALSYALNEADRKFFYKTDICINYNKCPQNQRNRCKMKYEKYVIPEKKDIIKYLKKLNKEIGVDKIEIKNNIIYLHNIRLSFNELSYLTDRLKTKIIVKKNKDDYYWNTSINNSEILKI